MQYKVLLICFCINSNLLCQISCTQFLTIQICTANIADSLPLFKNYITVADVTMQHGNQSNLEIEQLSLPSLELRRFLKIPGPNRKRQDY